MSATARPPASPVRAELARLVPLAVPLAISQAGNRLMGVVDTIMVGRLEPGSLGGLSIGNGLHFALTALGMGCVLGVEPIMAQAVGADEHTHARRAMWQGLYLALLVAVPITLCVLATPLILRPLGVVPFAAEQAQRYIWGRVGSILPFLWFIAVRGYLQAKHVTRPIVVAVVIANLVNVVLNSLLIYGDAALVKIGLPGIGLPALGVLGAGLSTTAVSILQLFILVRAAARVDTPPDPERRHVDWHTIRRALRLGVPTGIYIVLEISLFVGGSLLAGTLGKEAVDAHQIVLSLASFTFTFALGIGTATATRVGIHVGARNHVAARRAGVLGLAMGLAFMATSSLVFATLARPLASLFSDSTLTVSVATSLFLIAALFQLSDGAQVVAAHALRGAGDTRTPVWTNLFGHWLIGAPLIYYLVFRRHMGPVGIYWGFLAALTAVAIPLVVRFWRLSSRPIARI